MQTQQPWCLWSQPSPGALCKQRVLLVESSVPNSSPNTLPVGLKLLWAKKPRLKSRAPVLNFGVSPEAPLKHECWQHQGRPAQNSSPRAHWSLRPVLQSSNYIILALIIPFTGSKVLIKKDNQHDSRTPVGKPKLETVNGCRHKSCTTTVRSGDELQLATNLY